MGGNEPGHHPHQRICAFLFRPAGSSPGQGSSSGPDRRPDSRLRVFLPRGAQAGASGVRAGRGIDAPPVHRGPASVAGDDTAVASRIEAVGKARCHQQRRDPRCASAHDRRRQWPDTDPRRVGSGDPSGNRGGRRRYHAPRASLRCGGRASRPTSLRGRPGRGAVGRPAEPWVVRRHSGVPGTPSRPEPMASSRSRPARPRLSLPFEPELLVGDRARQVGDESNP